MPFPVSVRALFFYSTFKRAGYYRGHYTLTIKKWLFAGFSLKKDFISCIYLTPVKR